jgi:hypothetical protein
LGKATVKAVTNITAELAGVQLPESGRMKSKAVAADKEQAVKNEALEVLRKTPGKVLAVASKTTLVVSVGGKLGFKNGDRLNLYQTVDTKDDKGEVVFSDEKLVGEVTLDAVQDERSKATYAGDLDIKSGWIVRAK